MKLSAQGDRYCIKMKAKEQNCGEISGSVAAEAYQFDDNRILFNSALPRSSIWVYCHSNDDWSAQKHNGGGERMLNMVRNPHSSRAVRGWISSERDGDMIIKWSILDQTSILPLIMNISCPEVRAIKIRRFRLRGACWTVIQKLQ